MRISHVVKGTRPVTAELALLFGRAFAQSPQYWLNLQAAYDLKMAERARMNYRRLGLAMVLATVFGTAAAFYAVLTLTYKDGEKKIIVGPDAVILSNVPGNASDLKPGVNIAIPATTRKPDGTLETARVNIGRGDYVP